MKQSRIPVLAPALSIALSAGALAACVDAAPDEDSTASPLLGAPIDSANTWSVGVCAGPLNEDPAAGPIGACLTAGTRCTGTLIAKDLVLTARHCVHEIDYSQATNFCDGTITTTPLTSAPVRITTDPSVLGANVRWFTVAEILTSPVSSASCAGDVALLRLAAPVPRSLARPVDVDLRPLAHHLPDEVAVVGRGAIATVFDTTTYDVVSNDNGGFQRRKLEHVPVVCLARGNTHCVAPDIGAPFDVDPFYLEVGRSTSSGDSGAGYARQAGFDRGQVSIIAVNSAGTADPDTGIPNFAFGVRLDWHADFIRAALR